MCIAVLLPLATAQAQAQDNPPAHTEGQVEKQVTKTLSLRYLIALPEGYTEDGEGWPLILFLHGAGERGDKIDKVKKWGPPKMVEAGKDLGAIVLSPQCPNGSWWGAQIDALFYLLDEIEKQYNIDKDRIYVTGLSMGGYGTWELLSKAPDRFAAGVPICGGGNRYMGSVIGRHRVPVWNFHGDKDKAVPIDESRWIIRWVKQAGHEDVRFTTYEGVGHNSWSKAYADPQLWEWLFAQRASTRIEAREAQKQER